MKPRTTIQVFFLKKTGILETEYLCTRPIDLGKASADLKSLVMADRVAAAESQCIIQNSSHAMQLKNIIIDESEKHELREEAVECLAIFGIKWELIKSI